MANFSAALWLLCRSVLNPEQELNQRIHRERAHQQSALSSPFLIFSFLFDWFFLWIFHFQRVSNFFEIDGECDMNSKISLKVILFCRPLKLRKSRSCETEDWRSRGYKTSKYSRLVKRKNDFLSEKNIPWIAYSWKKLNIALGICYLVTLKFLYCLFVM